MSESQAGSIEGCLLTLEGRLDALTASRLDGQLQALYRQHCRVISLDMAQVTYISSSGLRILLLAHRRQQEIGGQLILRDLSPRIGRIMRLAGFDRILAIRTLSCPDPTGPTPKNT